MATFMTLDGTGGHIWQLIAEKKRHTPKIVVALDKIRDAFHGRIIMTRHSCLTFGPTSALNGVKWLPTWPSCSKKNDFYLVGKASVPSA